MVIILLSIRLEIGSQCRDLSMGEIWLDFRVRVVVVVVVVVVVAMVVVSATAAAALASAAAAVGHPTWLSQTCYATILTF